MPDILLGWESENRVPGGESLLKRAQRLLATLRENWRVGEGPQTLAEMRDCKKAEKEKKQAQEEAERNRLISLDDFYEKYIFTCIRKGTSLV